MGEGAGILGELPGAERPDFADPVDRPRAFVGREFLVAEDRQALLQAELEPVPAGDAVASPVVEVFVRDDRLDAGIIGIRGRVRARQHVLVVEDVEALVLHRAHVEVGDGDDVEHVEIVFPAEHALVPAHRALERIERVFGAAFLAWLHVDRDLDRATARGRVGLPDPAEASAHDREQVAGLGERVVPDREMAAGAVDGTRLDEVAVAEQDRGFLPVGLDSGRVDRQDVWPIDRVGDAPEAVGLALRAVDPARAIQPHQLRVRGRIDLRPDRQPEPPRWWGEEDEASGEAS